MPNITKLCCLYSTCNEPWQNGEKWEVLKKYFFDTTRPSQLQAKIYFWLHTEKTTDKNRFEMGKLIYRVFVSGWVF